MRLSPQLRCFAAVLFWSIASAVSAEPSNLMVADLTFARPNNWRWEPPPATSTATNRYVLPDSGDHFKTDIRFYIMNKDVSTEFPAIKSQFPQTKEQDIHRETLTVGKQKILFFQLQGTYFYRDHPPRPDQYWLSAAIPRGKAYIYARMQGPPGECEQEVDSFKKMVIDAVRDREEDQQ